MPRKITLHQEDIQYKTEKIYKGGMMHALFTVSNPGDIHSQYKIRYGSERKETYDEVMAEIKKWVDIKYGPIDAHRGKKAAKSREKTRLKKERERKRLFLAEKERKRKEELKQKRK